MDCFTAQIRVEFAAISPIVGKIFWDESLLNKEKTVNQLGKTLLRNIDFIGYKTVSTHYLSDKYETNRRLAS